MVIRHSSHENLMSPAFTRDIAVLSSFLASSRATRTKQEEPNLPGPRNNALFPSYMIVDMSLNRELQKCTSLSIPPTPLPSTYELKSIKITHQIFLYEVIKRAVSHKWAWGQEVIQVLCGCKLMQFGGGFYLKEKEINLIMKLNMHLE